MGVCHFTNDIAHTPAWIWNASVLIMLVLPVHSLWLNDPICSPRSWSTSIKVMNYRMICANRLFEPYSLPHAGTPSSPKYLILVAKAGMRLDYLCQQWASVQSWFVCSGKRQYGYQDASSHQMRGHFFYASSRQWSKLQISIFALIKIWQN